MTRAGNGEQRHGLGLGGLGGTTCPTLACWPSASPPGPGPGCVTSPVCLGRPWPVSVSTAQGLLCDRRPYTSATCPRGSLLHVLGVPGGAAGSCTHHNHPETR